MAGIDIMSVTPHQMSRDMRGYSVFMYGGWKTGKTTTAVKFPKHFLLAFEKGYSAIPGAMALPINSWSEFRQVLRQLKNDAAKERYETIIVDTADIAYNYCSAYICNNNGVDTYSLLKNDTNTVPLLLGISDVLNVNSVSLDVPTLTCG